MPINGETVVQKCISICTNETFVAWVVYKEGPKIPCYAPGIEVGQTARC